VYSIKSSAFEFASFGRLAKTTSFLQKPNSISRFLTAWHGAQAAQQYYFVLFSKARALKNSCFYVANLKGQSHEIFDLWFCVKQYPWIQ
jgi:hypothetical protein